MINRTQKMAILEDLKEKMVFLTGPRQVGKTTLAQGLLSTSEVSYLSWDDEDGRRIILNRSWDRTSKIVIFDEIHKRPQWKSWVKGIYDKEKRPPILVTGSSRLDIVRRRASPWPGGTITTGSIPFLWPN